MIAQASVKLHSGIKQRLVGSLEFALDILGLVTSIDVVAHHGHEIITDNFAVSLHLRSHFILRFVASSVVANHSKADRFLLQRQLHIDRHSTGRRSFMRREDGGKLRARVKGDNAASKNDESCN